LKINNSRKIILSLAVITCLFFSFSQQLYNGNEKQELIDNNPVGKFGTTPVNDPIVTTGFSYSYTENNSWSEGGIVYDVVVDGDFAYLANGDEGIKILDISDINNPSKAGFFDDGGTAYEIAVQGNYAYVADGADGLEIIDISTPSSPSKVGNITNPLGEKAYALYLRNQYAFVAFGLGGFISIDVSEPDSPRILDFYDTSGYEAIDVDGDGARAYVVLKNYGIKVISIGNPSGLNPLGSKVLTNNPRALEFSFIDLTRYLYVSVSSGIELYDLSNISDIKLDSWDYPGYGSENVAYNDSRLFVSTPTNGLRIYNETTIGDFDPNGGFYDSSGSGEAVFIEGTYVFLADGADGLEIVQLDSDGDKLLDGEEVNVYFTDHTDADTDDDAINDGLEVFVYSTDPNNNDTDSDLIADGEEVVIGNDGYITSPLNNDTDGDFLDDYYEIFTSITDPTDTDTDNDGLSDGAEVLTHSTDPNSEDTENDGMDDYYEIFYGLNPNVDDTELDLDSDGLANGIEYNYTGLLPNNNDTDGDNLSDGEEYYGIYYPENSYANATTGYITSTNPINFDTDSDGIWDGDEVKVYLTNPDDADSDSDGIDDFEEITVGSDSYITDPNSDDTDNDIMTDLWEINNGLDPTVNDSALDKDGDGLTNLEEFIRGLKANDADTDGDGMPDGWEVANSLNPKFDDAFADEDNDGLRNIREYEEGTDPNDADTDDDGMPDGWEYTYRNGGTNPLIADADEDPDNDGLTNLEEYNASTRPDRADTDGDGLTDGQEVLIYNTDPNDSDSDNDGFSDGAEIQAGTDPNDALSNPTRRRNTILTVVIIGGVVIISSLLAGFFIIYNYSRPEQKLLRYVLTQQKEGNDKLSSKELSIFVDKKLNRGEVKQFLSAVAEKHNLTIIDNNIWLVSKEQLQERADKLTDQIDSWKTKEPGIKEINSSITDIERNIKLGEKIDAKAQMQEFKDLLTRANQYKEKVEQKNSKSQEDDSSDIDADIPSEDSYFDN
jgi:hypothetical protein